MEWKYAENAVDFTCTCVYLSQWLLSSMCKNIFNEIKASDSINCVSYLVFFSLEGFMQPKMMSNGYVHEWFRKFKEDEAMEDIQQVN